jgi:hypothetical protein
VVAAAREEGEERGWAVRDLGIPPQAAPRRREGRKTRAEGTVMCPSIRQSTDLTAIS